MVRRNALWVFILLCVITQEVKPSPSENLRTAFIASQTSLGIGLYSWLLPAGLGLKDEGALALGLWTPAIALGGSYIATSNKRISGGTAYLSFIGGIDGCIHGVLLNSEHVRNSYTLPLILSLTENIGGAILAHKIGITPGIAQRKANYSVNGYYHTALISTITDADFSSRIYGLVSLIEGYGSLLLTRNDYKTTWGDALFESVTSGIGAAEGWLCVLTADLINDEIDLDIKAYTAFSLVGNVAGCGLGYLLSQRKDLTSFGGILTAFGPIIANGMVAGTLLLLNVTEPMVYPVLLAIGLPLTTWAIYRTQAKPEEDENVMRTKNINLGFYFNPYPLIFNKKFNLQKVQAPLLALELRF